MVLRLMQHLRRGKPHHLIHQGQLILPLEELVVMEVWEFHRHITEDHRLLQITMVVSPGKKELDTFQMEDTIAGVLQACSLVLPMLILLHHHRLCMGRPINVQVAGHMLQYLLLMFLTTSDQVAGAVVIIHCHITR